MRLPESGKDQIDSFADTLRTHMFDYYPHVSDLEGNAQFMEQINKISVLNKFKKIHEFEGKKTFEKMTNLPI